MTDNNININVNKLLVALNVKESDKFVLIREHDLADSNFIITHLMKQIFSKPNNKICLIILHNTIGHYHNVGKKIGYDLMAKIKSGHVKTIEPMTSIFEQLTDHSHDRIRMRCTIIAALLSSIKANIHELRQTGEDGKIYLMIDDLSHLFDIGVDFGSIIRFICTLNTKLYFDDVNVIVNMHIGDENDDKISHALEYYADVHIVVAPLTTGRSQDVTGVLTVNSSDCSEHIYHYKAMDKEIRTFKPGESLNYLYR